MSDEWWLLILAVGFLGVLGLLVQWVWTEERRLRSEPERRARQPQAFGDWPWRYRAVFAVTIGMMVMVGLSTLQYVRNGHVSRWEVATYGLMQATIWLGLLWLMPKIDRRLPR